MPRQKADKLAATIREMVHARLARHASIASARGAGLAHLDEDQLNAFVEGRLSDAESRPFVAHLVACHACRRATASLARLQAELGDVEIETVIEQEEPGRLRRLLERLTAGVASTHEEVLAYHDPAEDFKKEGDAEESKGDDQKSE